MSWFPRPLIATAVAGGVCFLIALVRPGAALSQAGDSSSSVAALLGQTLGGLMAASLIAFLIAMVIAVVLSVFKKRFSASLSRGYSIGVLVIAGLALLGNAMPRSNDPLRSGYSSAGEAESTRNAISGVEDDIHSMIAESVGPDGLPRRTEFRFSKNAPASDDMGRMRDLLQSFFNDMIGLQNAYLQALDDDGIGTLLDPDRVAQDEGFVESRQRLVKIKKSVADTRSKASRLLAEFPSRIKDHGFSSVSDQNVIKGYQEGMQSSLPLFREVWELEAKSVDHIEDLIDHLEATRMHWDPDQGMFAFQRDQDIERFNEIMAKITECVERQTEIRERSLKSATDKIGKLKESVP